MTLKDAKAVRDEVKSYGLRCIVPLGHGPDGYFARIFHMDGPIEFHSRAQARTYLAKSLWERRQKDREWGREQLRQRLLSRPRSPLEIMIDRACGIE